MRTQKAPLRATPVILVLLHLICALIPAHAQEALEARPYAVEVTAMVGSGITLCWPLDSDASGYYIYRKEKTATSWTPAGSATALATSWSDTVSVTPGTEWEYQVQKTKSGYSGWGYIFVGHQARPIVNRGKVILVVDNTYVASLARELARLENDLRGDGWTVIRHDVPRAPDTHPVGNATEAIAVRNFIKATYHQDPANVKAVLLFGRVPVFRSGLFFPDGHDDNPRAFPADAFYGDVTPNSFVTGFTPGTLVASSLNSLRGMRFTVGAAPLQVQALGRIYTNGNTRPHTLSIIKPSPAPATTIASVDWMPLDVVVSNLQIKYVPLATPVTLLANTEYYLVSTETRLGDRLLSFDTVVTSSGAATVSSAVSSTDGGTTWSVIGGAGNTFGPLGMLYTGAEQWSDGAGLWTDTGEDAGDAPDDFPDAGDGIYDQSAIPSDVELMVGRVDLAHLSGLVRSGTPPTELQLLRQYLNKNHDFRHKKGVFVNDIPRRGLIASRWGAHVDGSLHEAPAASGYRNFAPLFGAGPTQIITKSANNDTPADQRWISELENNSYLWAFGAGGGDHYKIAQMGTTFDGNEYRLETPDVYESDPQVVFTMLFGSAFVEWDVPDKHWPGNLMRAMLAAPNYTLTCSWAGRPHHYYHHMGLGETIGYGIRISQTNNNTLYQHAVGLETRGVHVSLMGDPTLRMHPVAPPSFVPGSIVQTGPGGVTLNWFASPDTDIKGYYLYKSSTPGGDFMRVPATGNPLIPATATSYTDTTATSGRPTYMLRAVKLETTAGTGSSTYTNLSQGVFLNGTWASTGALNAPPRKVHRDVLLPNGKVLVVGGNNITIGSLASAQAYTPSAAQWAGAGSMQAARHDHTATLLPSGKVLVVGGFHETSGFLETCELFDPGPNSWAPATSLPTERGGHTATLLSNGKVLIAGGAAGIFVPTAQVYDPTGNAWSSAGSLNEPRDLHTATLLGNGKVLVVGGSGTTLPTATSEEYDPLTGWTYAGPLGSARIHHSMTLLPDGRVLVAGGSGQLDNALATAELYNPGTRTWAPTGSMRIGRAGHTAVLLPNGKVLVAGGMGAVTDLVEAELYDPAAQTWSDTGSLTTARRGHTATLLGSGRVIVVGGWNDNDADLTSAELYDP